MHRAAQCHFRCRSAFTLTELMISIALSLVLILGVNAVFKLSSDSVGTGFQLMQMNRQFRLVGNTMNNDMQNMADYETAPALIIQSLNTPAFRDKTDMASEPAFTTGSLALDGMLKITAPTGGTLYPLPNTYPAWASMSAANLYKVRYEIPDDRNHRTDILSFFAKDQYRRQTQPALGNTSFFESDFTTSEAWISYGHVILPNNNTNVSAIQTWYATPPSPPIYALGLSATTATNNDPSNSGNPNNFYASQWVLGRTAMLLSDPTSLSTYVNPNSSASPKPAEPQNYFIDTANVTGQAITPALAAPLPPLGCTSTTNDNTMTPSYSATPIYYSLCDLAGASMGTFRNTVLTAEYQTTGTASDLWYLPLVANPYTGPSAPPPGPDSTYRFLAKPWPNKTATGQAAMGTNMAQEVARTIPVFARGCSQFIVEYAGDYLQQDATTGAVKDIGEDGQLDYDLITNSNTSQTYKRIRWYGLTRSLDNGVTVEDASQAIAANPPGPADTEIVRPLWRYISQTSSPAATNGSITHLPFEKTLGNGFPQTTSPTPYQYGYTCAWAPDDMHLDESQRLKTDVFYNLITLTPGSGINSGKPYFPSRSMLPWLIRVTVRLDDPNGRLPQGQQMEFIFKVNRPH